MFLQNNPLNKLLDDNKGVPGRGFSVKAAADNSDASVYLYDIISSHNDWNGVTAENFSHTLAAITAPTIHLHINSPGGDVFAGRAMAAAIKGHPSNVIAHVDGYAASAASYVALAADQVEMAEGSFFMIHNAWTIAFGSASDLQKTANLLSDLDASIAETYVNETGQSLEDIQQWMNDETWFGAQEAVDKGFADRMQAQNPNKASNQAAWNLSAYRHAPKPTEPVTPTKSDTKPPVAESDDGGTAQRERELKLVAA